MLWLLLSAAWIPSQDPTSVLVFTKTAKYHDQDFEYRHTAIPNGIRAIRELGESAGWRVTTTEDGADFNDENLKGYDVVIFLLNTGDVLSLEQQVAFERYIQSGGGYVGVHSASDTEHAWPWYRKLVGATFKSHPPIQEATYTIEDRAHPATRELPEHWTRTDEHYNFHSNPRAGVHVLVSLDESSYTVGEDPMGDHPIAWYHAYDGGRAFYTALGHVEASYTDPVFLGHLKGGIEWASSR